MPVANDYYGILGVRRDAGPDEIKKAYRRLARDLHPDVNPDPALQERFKEVTQAYEVLSDPEKRRSYDMFGHAGVGQGTTSGFEGFGFGDIFDTFFGGGVGSRSGRRASRGDGQARRGARSSGSHGERRHRRRGALGRRCNA